MRIYSYSSESIAFVEIRWMMLKCIVSGALFGAVLFFILFTLYPSEAKIFRSGEANSIEVENVILQRQVDEIVSSTRFLNVQVKHLHEYSGKLDSLLFRSVFPGDTTSALTVEAKIFRFQSLLFASTATMP